MLLAALPIHLFRHFCYRIISFSHNAVSQTDRKMEETTVSCQSAKSVNADNIRYTSKPQKNTKTRTTNIILILG